MKRFYARKTYVEPITIEISQNFIDNNHRQGKASISSSSVNLGIFSKNDSELLGVAQFCTPRTTAKKKIYSTELIRLCFKKDYRIVGGASKLIKYYIQLYSPADIFTYQDTTGETTNVYEECGFKLVKTDKQKSYLVKPGKTLNSAERGEYYTLAEVVRRGPDALLKTKIGEVFKENGKRKTNIELFVDELGWHVEKTSGDKTFEWINPDVTFYTYKITATNSSKYYYGVSHVKKPNATKNDCLNDGYYGSGGVHNHNNKFTNWKKKHKECLQKTVLNIFSRKYLAYEDEKKLIGDKYRTDPLCLNSIPDGSYTGISTKTQDKIRTKFCPVHGLTKHIGDTCAACVLSHSITLQNCPIHGRTKHIGDTCYKCKADKSIQLKECPVHGLSKHIGNSCYKCCENNPFKTKIKVCSIHGETKHINNHCVKCLKAKRITFENCPVHGNVKHENGKCLTCRANESISMKICPIHGETKHNGDTCCKCNADKNIQLRECPVHGLTKHIGNSCYICLSAKKITFKECPVHGLTKHIGDKCYACRKKTIYKDTCPEHGVTSFKNGKCMKCAVTLKVCPIHGLTKHTGNTCYKCRSLKITHSRFHKTHKKDDCIHCHPEDRIDSSSDE